MKVRMKKDKQAAPDGIHVLDYVKGRTYEIPDDLAGRLIDLGFAAAVKASTKPHEPEETKVEEPEETKDEEPEKEEAPPATKKKK